MVKKQNRFIWIETYSYGFIVYIKADDTYKDIAEDVETRFDTANYELNGVLNLEQKLIVT